MTKNIKLMEDIMKYCVKYDLFTEMTFYADNHIYSSEPSENSTPHETSWGTYYETGTYENLKDRIEYGNPDTLTIAFEGPFYHAYNGYSRNSSVCKDIEKIAHRYGLYSEQGYAWSLSFYPE